MNATEEYLTEAFIEQGLTTREQVQQLLEQARQLSPEDSSGHEGLDAMNLLLHAIGLPKEEVVNFLAAELSMPVIDLTGVRPGPEVLGLLSPENARRYEALPLGSDGTSVDLLLGDPLDQEALDNLGHLLGQTINPCLAYREDVLEAIGGF